MCPKRYGQSKRRPTLTTIRRVNGVRGVPGRRIASRSTGSAAIGKNRRQLVWRNHLELSIRTVARVLVGAPFSKLRQVTEAGTLHVLVGDFNYQLGPQRLPRQVLALAPAALATRHAMPIGAFSGCVLRPALPGVIGERVLAIGREVFYQLPTLLLREA